MKTPIHAFPHCYRASVSASDLVFVLQKFAGGRPPVVLTVLTRPTPLTSTYTACHGLAVIYDCRKWQRTTLTSTLT